MTDITKPISIRDYLDFEEKEARDNRARWTHEFESFCALGDLYQLLASTIKITQKELDLPVRLFLAVESQMYGVVSQLLRRRTTDALTLTRRAIEATGVAYRIWTNPELAETFISAYPDVEKTGDPKQWRASQTYKEEFSSAKLFSQEGPVWERLKITYAVLSAMASHAGPGVLKDQEDRDLQRYMHFVNPDEEDCRRHWFWIMGFYYEMLRVFLRILQNQLAEAILSSLEKDLIAWREWNAAQFEKADKDAASLGSKDKRVLCPEEIRFLFSS